jgi:hypothetical protein
MNLVVRVGAVNEIEVLLAKLASRYLLETRCYIEQREKDKTLS